MTDSENIKKALLDILDKGERSVLFNIFYKACLKFSIATLLLEKNRNIKNEAVAKLGCSLKDLACDCISDLFERKDEKFIHIENYFYKKSKDELSGIHPDIIKVNLAMLIKAKTNQQLSELREAYGEIYFKIKKSASIYLERQKSFIKQIYFKNIKFLYTCSNNELVIEQTTMKVELLLGKLYEMRFNKYQIPEIIRAIFVILNNQNEYCKAISINTILNTLKIFYINRMNDREIENVEYYKY